MPSLKTSVLVIGIVAILTGLVWIGQGSGYFPYPSYSFMINQTPWINNGIVLAVMGLIAVIVALRM